MLLFMFVTAAITAGCALRPPQEEIITKKIKLYYGDINNERLVTEERQFSYRRGEDKYKAALEELIKGPRDDNHRSNISPETKVYGTIKQGRHLIIDFSREFNNFGGSVAEIMARGSVVNTMTQFEEIDRVKLLVEGEEYIGPSGQPLGFMGPFPTSVEPPRITSEVTLYFGKKDATAVVGESRVLTIPPDTDRNKFIRIVLEELIKGPQRGDLSPTIPRGVKVLSVEIREGTAYVDFSQEMQTQHPGGAAGEAMTINSIVNTLTEFVYIQRVKMTVEGEPMLIEHAFLEEPVERNEGMIER
jgi:germination protein M